MRTMAVVLLLAVLPAIAVPAWAEDTATRDTAQTRVETELSKVDEILKIIGLPGVAEKARESGVPDEDIRIILEEVTRRKLPPTEAETILLETSTAVRENGPVDNFGAFVQSKLREGLRGRDLAAAIHEEHRLRGKGKGHLKDKKAGKGKGMGKGNGQGQGKGQSLDKDKPAVTGDGVYADPDDDRDDDDDQDSRRKNKKGKK